MFLYNNDKTVKFQVYLKIDHASCGWTSCNRHETYLKAGNICDTLIAILGSGISFANITDPKQ